MVHYGNSKNDVERKYNLWRNEKNWDAQKGLPEDLGDGLPSEGEISNKTQNTRIESL